MHIVGREGELMLDARAARPLPAGVDHLHTIVGHHLWATLRLIDRCLKLLPEQLELSTPGTFGSIHATLEHRRKALNPTPRSSMPWACS